MPTPRELWAAGDWPAVSKTILGAVEGTIAAAGIGPGATVLDVGAGDGNTAIPAALTGAKVIALDVTPELFESGRARAAQAGVEIEWVEGDAMDLPYEDGRFDAVISNFGAMFAPHHARTAAELSRVAKPDGRVVMTTWSTEGMNGELFAVIGRHMPPSPPDVEPSYTWGDPDHVRACFAPTGRSVEIAVERLRFQAPSPEEWVEFMSRSLGPMAMARAAHEQAGTWDAMRADLVAHYTRFNEGDGTFDAHGEYLRVVAG